MDQLCDRLRDKPVGAFLRALVTASTADPSCTELRLRYVADLLTPFHAAFHAHGGSEASAVSENVIEEAGIREAVIQEATMTIVSPLLVDALLLDHAVDRERAHRAVGRVLARIHLEENVS